MGTPEYMAPEQAAGQPADPRSDIYAVGSIMYEMLSGTPPYEGDNVMEVLHKKANEPPQSLAELRPDLPPAVVALVERAMARSPDARPQSMADLAYEIHTIETALVMTPPPVLVPHTRHLVARRCPGRLPGRLRRGVGDAHRSPFYQSPTPVHRGRDRGHRALGGRHDGARPLPRRQAVERAGVGVGGFRPHRGAGLPPPVPTMPDPAGRSRRGHRGGACPARAATQTPGEPAEAEARSGRPTQSSGACSRASGATSRCSRPSSSCTPSATRKPARPS